MCVKTNLKVSHRLVLGPYKVQKEVKSTQKKSKKNTAKLGKSGTALKSLGEKSCEIKGGGQEMAAIMLMLKKLIMAMCIVKIY